MNKQAHDQFSPEEYGKLKSAIEDMVWINDMQEMVLDLARAMKIMAATGHPEGYDAEGLANEAFYEKLVLKLLLVIGELKNRHNGYITLPEYPAGTDTLSSQEKAKIEADRAREKAMQLKGEDIEFIRLGLKQMYESSIQSTNGKETTPQIFKKKWEALDAELEADIKMKESLQVH